MSRLGMDADAVEATARALRSDAEALAGLVHAVDAAIGRLPAAWDGPARQHFVHGWQGTHRPTARSCVDALRHLATVALANAAEQRRVSGILEGAGALAAWPGLTGTAESAPAPPTGGGTTPAQNAQWWGSLTPEQQRWVIEHHPDWVGNRDGVPFAVRDEANRAQLAGHLQDSIATRDALVEERRRLLAGQAWNKGGLAGAWDALNPTDEAFDAARIAILDKQIQYAQERVDSNLKVQQVLRTTTDAHLVLFDPSGLKTKAAVSVGDLDQADHIGVFTPGISTRVESSLSGYVDDVTNLREQTESLLRAHNRGDETVAMVAWLGYEAPDNPLQRPDDIWNPNRATWSEWPAERGGASLNSFYAGIDAARPTDAHVVALGHSYGSTTTSHALQQGGTHVDDVVFFGSPGLSVRDASDLQIAGHSYLLEARGDGVADIGRFGGDASSVRGVTHLSTGASDTAGGEKAAIGGHGDPFGRDHGEYLMQGTTSQWNIAAVVAGEPQDAVTGSNSGFGDAFRKGLDGPPPTLPVLRPWAR